jgi:hypothetical protein
VLTPTGTLPQAGTETVHFALALVDATGAKRTLGEGDVVFAQQSSTPPPLSFTVAADASACGGKLVVTMTHPTGTNTVYFLFVALDLP